MSTTRAIPSNALESAPVARGLLGMPRPVALVLGGGGCAGAAQAGVLVALEERGFAPDLVVGTSVGALNGAVVAARPGAAASWLTEAWLRTRRHDVLSIRPPWRREGAGGVFSTDGLRRLIARAELPLRLDDLPIRFHAVATDVTTGSIAVMSAGNLESALLASTAIPGVLPPVERNGHVLVDGGVVANVPVLAALEAGAASMVVVRSGPEALPPPSGSRPRARLIAARSGRLLVRHQIERDLLQASLHVPTVVMPTGVDCWPHSWDLSQSERLITTARAASRAFLEERETSSVSVDSGAGRLDSLPSTADRRVLKWTRVRDRADDQPGPTPLRSW